MTGGEVTAALPAEPSSAGAARRVVARALHNWGRDDLADVATLLTSELVTNAIVHARTHLRLVLKSASGRLRVEVHDGSSVLPALKHYSREATTGRGLHFVATLADAWGAELADAKFVWFELSAPRADGRRRAAGEVQPEISEVSETASGNDSDGSGRDAGSPDTDLVDVRLCVPVAPMRRSTEYHEGLFREFALITARESAEAHSVPARLVRLIESLRPRFGEAVTGLERDLAANTEPGHDWVDVAYRVPLDVGDGVSELLVLLDEADAYCRAGKDLLTLACPDDVLMFRRWLLGEFVSQPSGARPTPFPGPAEPTAGT